MTGSLATVGSVNTPTCFALRLAKLATKRAQSFTDGVKGEIVRVSVSFVTSKRQEKREERTPFQPPW